MDKLQPTCSQQTEQQLFAKLKISADRPVQQKIKVTENILYFGCLESLAPSKHRANTVGVVSLFLRSLGREQCQGWHNRPRALEDLQYIG